MAPRYDERRLGLSIVELSKMINNCSEDARSVEEDARLDSGFNFQNTISRYALNPQSIFLSGASGFLGVYLLKELLSETEADIYCLLRATDRPSAQKRVRQHMESYGLWHSDFDRRIIPVVGDLILPAFGLDDSEFNFLARTIDVIFHCAGMINMLYPYERLKPVNITGVKEALGLAGHIQSKPFHYVSSLAIFFNDAFPPDRILKEDDRPQYHPSIKSGYGKSKIVADQMVTEAQNQGLPVCIYRPTRIMGHSQTGALNETSELLPRLLKGCVLLGCYPLWDIEVTWVPVDYVSRSIVHLAFRADSWGKSFHLFNAAPIGWEKLMNALKTAQYPLEGVPPAEWFDRLRQQVIQKKMDNDSDQELLAWLIIAFKTPHYLFYKRPPFSDENIKQGLAGTNITCPPITPDMITSYISYWQKKGFFPMPPGWAKKTTPC